MNDDELKLLWQRQPLRNPVVPPDQLVSAMQKRTTLLRSILNARDVRELVACAFVIILFGFFYFTVYRTPVSRLGALIVIASSVFIAWKLVHTRRKTPPAPPGATVVASLQAELNSVRAQSRLLGSVLWWYLLPLGVGILVCTWGSPGSGLAGSFLHIGYTLFVIALCAFLYRLNRRARTQQLLPVEAQLASLIHSAKTGEPLEERHLANLRPIVLSMAAADKVKPIEFKVAFWQLALYGVPGIVGIWFFIMMDLTLSDDHWKVKERALEPHAPSVRPGTPNETNRYVVVTRKLVDLFNAGDYAAVQKLYNPQMSRVFPLKETTEFYTRLATNFGKIESFEGPTGDGYRSWTAFRLDYQHGGITMSLVLDADDKISGIHFEPVSTRYAVGRNIKPFLRRFFSWQHLLWGVLSLLGGLIYTWLIQKTTRRAVGISTLGIHLSKGQRLILWDEIREVRPFRFLNIRNLSLITESGETTRMHWTPLERHSDVKTAVETFAPANHPIRKYLTLLRRT